MSTQRRQGVAVSRSRRFLGVEVDAVVLDDLLAEIPCIDVLTVDVEAAEARILSGLARTLAAHPAITSIAGLAGFAHGNVVETR